MVRSEMVRNPESWQVDFQPSLKWDYCHGLELGAMMDVYDRYGDSKFYDYALAYADTMVNEDGTIKKYKLTDYSLDRINSGKMLFRIYEQTKDEKYKKALNLLRLCSLMVSLVMKMAVFGIKKFILIKCGWMGFIWGRRFLLNMLIEIMIRMPIRK